MFHAKGPSFFELARQALSSTERGYDLLAPKFDYTPFRTSDLVLDQFVESIRPLGHFDSVLDVCCGTGAAMQKLLPLCKNRLCGIDFSQGMLSTANSIFDQLQRSQDDHEGPNIEFTYGNALELPFEEEFEFITSFGAFGHILPRDEPSFVEQIYKALRPGGHFAFVTTTRPSVLSATYWLARGFNGAMHVRNLLWKPRFVMFYLTFLWPDIELILREKGFDVTVSDLFPDQPRFQLCKLVVATKTTTQN